ncbi:ISAzo13 family transposase, partial [Kamptonema animale CS-326]|uniref:ISAzo13-like element transposase-related protein n=1 Tax=Kamptonema animale TaxID=92934 RepID=UPI003A90782E|nr:ISAzo13 family transposase [Kamptonema animale CS-326]
HDFWSLGHGKVIPHGIYDAQENRGYITLGNSKDTSEFACESLKSWWRLVSISLFVYPR